MSQKRGLTNRRIGLEFAEGLLRDALRYAVAYDAPRSAAKIRRAIKSMGGAIRHAANVEARAIRRAGGGKSHA